ncbi:hypothetical protein Lalb_Chr03g0027581 [Lupinus albus]|uniref:Uncharacterized protein n=1 Tax=Lupinus albus TaxID=3870 RepID=A0A6A4QSR2_LUPAL|nr:hypothetical protein Lalb_Chr03g0027581 [Lupinus albus]
MAKYQVNNMDDLHVRTHKFINLEESPNAIGLQDPSSDRKRSCDFSSYPL